MCKMQEPVIARSRRAAPALVCQKCLDRHPKGGRIRRALKRAMKHRPAGETKPPRLVRASCFGICPKRAVVVASGQSLLDDAYVLVASPRQAAPALELLLP
jgi:hypothetical protein